MQIDYKSKYKELKLKLKEMADLSFRLGVQEGMRQSQVQQAQQAQASAEQAAQQAQGMQPGQPGQDGQPGQPGEEQQAGQPQSDGTELDQHINELESMLHKTESTSPNYQALSKSIASMKTMQAQLKKKHADKMIADIGKAMKKPFVINAQAEKNMQTPAKKALNKQEELIKNIMDGWAKEESDVLNKVTKTLGIEGILKG